MEQKQYNETQVFTSPSRLTTAEGPNSWPHNQESILTPQLVTSQSRVKFDLINQEINNSKEIELLISQSRVNFDLTILERTITRLTTAEGTELLTLQSRGNFFPLRNFFLLSSLRSHFVTLRTWIWIYYTCSKLRLTENVLP